MLTAVQPAGSRRAAELNADAAGGGASEVEQHARNSGIGLTARLPSKTALRPHLWLHGSRRLKDIYDTTQLSPGQE